MFRLQALGAETLASLMASDGERRPDLSWILFGPTEPAVVAPVDERDAPPMLMAAE